jgi:hypothetical protein
MTHPSITGHLPQVELAIAEMLIKKHNMTKSKFVRQAVKMYCYHLQRSDLESSPDGAIIRAIEEEAGKLLVANFRPNISGPGLELAPLLARQGEIKKNIDVFEIKRQAGRPPNQNKQQGPGRLTDRGTNIKRTLED